MGGKWLYSCCIVEVLFLRVVQNNMQHAYEVSLSFFSKRFIKVQLVQPYCSTEQISAQKKYLFILSEISGFHMINKLSVEF